MYLNEQGAVLTIHPYRSGKELTKVAIAAFIIGNSWAFARRSQFSVKGLPLKDQDTDVKEQGSHLRVKVTFCSTSSDPIRSEAKRNQLALISSLRAYFKYKWSVNMGSIDFKKNLDVEIARRTLLLIKKVILECISCFIYTKLGYMFRLIFYNTTEFFNPTSLFHSYKCL